jgi:hypothetical protein
MKRGGCSSSQYGEYTVDLVCCDGFYLHGFCTSATSVDIILVLRAGSTWRIDGQLFLVGFYGGEQISAYMCSYRHRKCVSHSRGP